MNHKDVIQNFFNGKNYKGSLVFAEDNTLYSFGRHFPLAVRRTGTDGKTWFLLNGDKYSRSTSKHQSYTYRADSPRVSFTALHAAGMNYERCQLVDYQLDELGYVSLGDRLFKRFKSTIPTGAEYHEDKDKNGVVYRKWYHRIGGVVLEQDGKYYLCAMDESSYFISQLPKPVKTVREGFEALKPGLVQLLEEEGAEIKRQGEWFFIKCEGDAYKKTIRGKKWAVDGVLPLDHPDSNRHICTRLLMVNDFTYARGTVRHKTSWGGRGDHKRLKLGKDTYRVFHNAAAGSWSASGSVD